MRHKNIALFALSAALLLSACNTDKAATTAATTEAATTTTASSTTTAEVTTAVTATTLTTVTTEETTAKTTEIKHDESEEIQGEGRQNRFMSHRGFMLYEPVNDDELEMLRNKDELVVFVMAESDLSWLAECTKLKKLVIYEGQDDCPSPPDYNYVDDYSFLRSLTVLKSLRLDNLDFDISDIDGLGELEELEVIFCGITGRLSGNTVFEHTQTIRISSSSIDDLGFLRLFPNITELELSWCNIHDKTQMNVINELTELKKLRLSQIDKSGITSLSNLKKLEELHVCDDNPERSADIRLFDGLDSLKKFNYFKNVSHLQPDGTYILEDQYSTEEIAYFEKTHPECEVWAYEVAF